MTTTDPTTARLLIAVARHERALTAARSDLYSHLRARMASGDTAYALARETGLSQAALSKIRNGAIGRTNQED